MSEIIKGFDPVFDENSIVLILGSFPSVKSRAVDFYYGNRQNKFWDMLYGYFGEKADVEIDKRRNFLLQKRIAVWDIVTACEIEGSSDASIRNFQIADLSVVFNVAKIESVLLNGAVSYKIFCSRYSNCGIAYERMPSTSPANVRWDLSSWYRELDRVFGR